MENYDIVQLPTAARGSFQEIEKFQQRPACSIGMSRFSPMEIIQVPAARRSGPKEIERLPGGPSANCSKSGLRVPAYEIVQVPEKRRSGSKEIEKFAGGSSPTRILRVPSLPKEDDIIDAENRKTKEYTSIASLVKYSRSESMRSARTSFKNPILERACSVYLQPTSVTRKKEGVGSLSFWHLCWELLCKIWPTSCFGGSSDDDCDRLVDCHNLDGNLDTCDGLLECRKVD
ncbi:unnamed protein product [Calypogeia fissa]